MTQAVRDKIYALSRHYFALRDEMSTQLGFTRVELHDMAKRQILPMMTDEDSNWEVDEIKIGELMSNPLSTKYLSVHGWEQYIEHFKIFVHH